MSAEPKKPGTAEAKPEAATEPHQAAKHQKRTARRTRYVRRFYMPYPGRWYYDAAGTRGWGGGQFGPSPYSSNGQ